MNKSISSYLIFLLLIISSSCSKQEGETMKQFEIAEKDLQKDFQQSAGSLNITVSTTLEDTEWTVRSDVAWCSATQRRQNGKPVINLTVQSNEGKSVRTAKVSVHSSVKDYEITVRQLGYEATVLVNPQSFTFGAGGGGMEFTVTTNVEVEIIAPEWITEAPVSRANAMVSNTYNYMVKANDTDASRTGNVEIREKIPAGATEEPMSELIAVTQKGLGYYGSGDVAGQIPDDVKLKIVSGSASNKQNGQDIDKSFDGDKGTLYHSSWSQTTFPVTLTWNLETTDDVDYLVYHPRSDGSNGNFKEVDILYSVTGGEPFIALKSYDFKGSGSATFVAFDNTVHAKSFRFVVKSGVGDNGTGFASCAEMEFYRRNPESFDYSTLFTDETCSELKSGVTEENINACPYPFFKNIAWYMFKGAYPREFRIADYKAWPNPDIQATMNRTAAYSQLDNPTGIAVKGGETLVVMVGDTQGRSISLRTQNYEPPPGSQDGYGFYKTYPLKNGTNKIAMADDGLVYIMYHTSTLEEAKTAPPVRIHIATGTVNGYFDAQNPTHNGRWKELIDKASNRYFDLVGKYVHMTFETAAYRQYTTQGKELADLLDRVVDEEQRLLGLYKYGNVFENRLYMHVMYNTSVLYAASYHTGFNMKAQSWLLSPAAFPAECWGPAHEIGHVNQVRPGVRWQGMTEVTNNIMSLYIQTTILGKTSRLQSGGNYLKGAQELFPVGGKAFCQCTDLFNQLVPFWQLELYFGNVLGETPLRRGDGDGFYPKVYQYARTKDYTNIKNNAGALQLDFVYNCCQASGKNLLNFFDKWGFLKLVKHTEEDYGSGEVIVTEAMVNDLKARVNALGYSAPAANIEYISDDRVEAYKNPQPITTGTVSKSGNTVTLTGWKNVVAYEVCDSADKIISVSAGSSTNINLPEECKLYAVPVSGTRQLIPLTRTRL